MSQVEPNPSERGSSRGRLHLFVCWIVLALVVVGVINRDRFMSRPAPPRSDDPPVERKAFGGGEDLQAMIIVAMQRAAPGKEKEVADGAHSLNTGDPMKRLRFVALISEMIGPDAGLAALSKLEVEFAENDVKLSDADKATFDALYRLLESYSEQDFSKESLLPEDQSLIEQRLHWPGRMLLQPSIPGTPDSPAREKLLEPAIRLLLVSIGLSAWLLFGGFGGLIGLFVMLLLWMKGKLLSRLGPPISHGVLYAETFILWPICFFGLTWAMPRLIPSLQEVPLLSSALSMFLSLIVLVWPVLRGVSWRQVRSDIGLTWGDQPILNILSGIGTYFMMLPFAALGVAVFIGLLSLKSRMGATEARMEDHVHPIVYEIASGTSVWQMYLLAVIAAPIVEEIMFRGVLYRHLREATRCCSATGSFLFSMIVNSTIFAIIHPQGLLAAPILAGLAFGLTIAREWRGSLIACIIPHSISNFIIASLAVSIFG